MVRTKIEERGLGLLGLLASLCLVTALLGGCTGDTDGGSGATADGEEFVDSDGATGSIRLSVVEEEMQVSETSGFIVEARNSAGAGASNLPINCDTEEGLALLEPTSGTELTDSSGSMSGRVGCTAPGSFRMGCRLAVGANKRKFVTVRCSGPVPAGFDGFDDAGGGGLGGGVDVDDDGGVGGGDTAGVRITSVEFLDDGIASDSTPATSSLDIAQETCGTSAEPFFDSFVRIKVQNNTNQNVRCSSYTYSVPNGSGASTATLTSDSISFINEAIPASGGSGTIIALFLDVVDANCVGSSGTEGCKRFSGGSSVIADDFGFRNVSFRVSCTNDLGDAITLRATASASFDNFNSCSS